MIGCSLIILYLEQPKAFIIPSINETVVTSRSFQMSLETEVEQMINDMIKKEGMTRSHILHVLRSKFESEERYQEVAYVNSLLKKEDNTDNNNGNTDFQRDY